MAFSHESTESLPSSSSSQTPYVFPTPLFPEEPHTPLDALAYAIIRGEVNEVQQLIEEFGIDVNERVSWPFAYLPIDYVKESKQYTMNGYNKFVLFQKTTPLQLACYYGNIAIIQLLVGKGADLFAVGHISENDFRVHRASNRITNHIIYTIVRNRLWRYHPTYYFPQEQFNTLVFAADNDHFEIIKLFWSNCPLEIKLDILANSVEKGFMDIAEFCLKAPDVQRSVENTKHYEGDNQKKLLTIACVNKDRTMIDLLL